MRKPWGILLLVEAVVIGDCNGIQVRFSDISLELVEVKLEITIACCRRRVNM